MLKFTASYGSVKKVSGLELIDGLYKRVKISPFDAYGNWILLEEFTYDVGYKGSSEKITIPAGFVFNGLSIPKLFRWIATPMDTDTIIAALVHDWLFYTRQYTLEKSDYIFYEVMKECGVRWSKRTRLFLGLKCGSWYVWKKYGMKS